MPLPMTTSRSLAIVFVNPRGADLELRHAAHGIQRVVRETVRRAISWPVKWHEDRVRTYVGRDFCGEGRGSSARANDDLRSVGQAMAPCLLRMDFRERLRCHVGKLRDSARLRPRLIVRKHAPGRQAQRELLVGLIGGKLMLDGMKARPPADRWKGVGEQPARAGVACQRTARTRRPRHRSARR